MKMLKKQLFSFSLIFALIFAASFNSNAQNDEDWVTKKYEFGEFSKIYLEGSYKVFLSQGKKAGVVLKTTEESMFDHLSVKYFGDRVSFKMDNDFLAYKRVHLYITFDELDDVRVAGGLRMYSEGYIEVDDLDVTVQGGAKVGLKLKAKNLGVVGEGGVWVDLEGVTKNLDVSLSGAGHVNASDLKADDVNFKIEGVGTGKVHAEKTLYGRIEGVGKIRYTGNPKVTRNVDGLGSIERD